MSLKKLPDVRLFAVAIFACLLAFCAVGAFAKDSDEDDSASPMPEPSGEFRATKAFASMTEYLRKGNYRAAFPLVKVMADKGYPDYQALLAKLYMNGQGAPKSPKQAAEWYALAAKGGSREAQSNLGKMYFNGVGVPQDFKAARKWLELAANDGEALVLLGRIYSDGLGTDRDYSKAIDAFRRADERGTDTKIIIGILYSQGGFGVEKNFTQAKKWLEMAANQKNALAQCALGFVYFEGGHGLKKDLDKAKKCINAAKPVLEKKAATGNPAALTWLGRLSYLGMFQPRDFARARKYFEASADGDSLHMLGVMAKKGQGGLKKDNKKAMELFRRADASGSFPAKVSIGELYYLGQGVPKNLCEAKKWFEQGGKNEDPVARFYLGMMYAKGECCKQDMQRAQALLQQAKPALELALATNEDCANYLKILNADYADLSTMSVVAAAPVQPVEPEAPKVPEVKPVTPAQPVTPSQPARDFKAVSTAIEALVLEYYPRAKIVKTDKSVHFEFRVKSLILPSRKQSLVPESEGIVGDLNIKPGRYDGTEILPYQTNETYYVSLLMAPYSEPGDCHMLTKMLFPPSTAVEFVKGFKQIVNSYQ